MNCHKIVRAAMLILAESLCGALVFILCVSLPELLGLPSWTLPLFGVPLLLYLNWRLGERPPPRLPVSLGPSVTRERTNCTN